MLGLEGVELARRRGAADLTRSRRTRRLGRKRPGERKTTAVTITHSSSTEMARKGRIRRGRGVQGEGDNERILLDILWREGTTRGEET